MRDIGGRLGVSAATVSLALSGHSSISASMRDKVVLMADEMGYQPNKRLSKFFKIARKANLAVAFLVDPGIYDYMTASQSFYARIQWAVQAALDAGGGHMLLANAATNLIANGNLYAVEEGMADAVIAEVHDAEIVKRLAVHVPVVLLNVELPDVKMDVVLPDVEGAVREQIAHLIQLGHRRIACFRSRVPLDRWQEQRWQDRRFWREYETYSADKGLEVFEEYIMPIHFKTGEHQEAIAAFLDRVLRPGIEPTAILTFDMYAVELIRQLNLRGLVVPQDISIMGYDDDTHGPSCPIPMTTFRQNFDEMARTAVELVRSRLEEPDRPARVVEVADKLIERSSTAQARSKPLLPQGGSSRNPSFKQKSHLQKMTS